MNCIRVTTVFVWFLMVVFLAPIAHAESPAADLPSGVITLHNGNALSGQMIGGRSGRIEWQSPHFATPFEFPIPRIQSIQLSRRTDRVASGDPLRLVTVAGNALTGKLVGMTDDQFQIRSQRFGDFTLQRKLVRQIRWIGVRSTLQDGPLDKQEWQSVSRGRSMDEWTESKQGQLKTDKVGAELFRPFDFPDVAEVEIELQWKGKPNFELAIAKPVRRRLPKGVIKIETWSEQLVLQSLASNGAFETLVKFDQQKSIRLRIVLDQQLGEMAVYSDLGQLLGKLAAEKQQPGAGIYLKNKGSDLTLVSLRVNSFDEPKGVDTQDLARLEFRDGHRDFAKLHSYDRADQVLHLVGADGKESVVPFESIIGINFQKRANEPARRRFRVVCHDKLQVFGRLERISQNQVVIRCDAAVDPIVLRLEDVWQMWFLPEDVGADAKTVAEKEVEREAFTIELDGKRLIGRPAPVGGDAPVGWKPAGSDTASRFVKPAGREMRRIDDQSLKSPIAVHPLRDIVYLRSGDVIPCHVNQIDDQSVHIETGFSASQAIPRQRMRAVEWDRDLHRQIPPMKQWQRNGNVTFGEDDMTFAGQSRLSHDKVLRGSEVEFDLEWHRDAYLILSLFTGQARRGQPNCPTIMMYRTNNQFVIQVNNSGREMWNEKQKPENRKTHIRIVTGRKQIIVAVDGKEVIHHRTGKIDRSATGMTWQVQPLGGNRGLGRGAQIQKTPLLTLSHLRIGQSGMLAQLNVSDPLRRSLVTVPRSRRGNPSPHLLVARNGDLLRGRLMGLSQDRLQFISRSDDIVIDRERTSGIVWLDGIEEIVAKLRKEAGTVSSNEATSVEEEALPDEKTNGPKDVMSDDRQWAQATFASGARLKFRVLGMTEQHLEGSHPLLGAMRVPLDSLKALKLGPFGEEPKDLAVWKRWKLEPAEEPKFAETPTGDDDSGQMSGKSSPLVGKQVPLANCPLLKGKAFRVREHVGQVVVLDFWATWCGPCIKELPKTIKTVGAFAAEDVVLIGVNYQENRSTIEEFLKMRGWDLQVGLDREGKLAAQFGVDAIPQTVVIGPKGKVQRVYVGSHRGLQDAIRQTIEELLEKP